LLAHIQKAGPGKLKRFEILWKTKKVEKATSPLTVTRNIQPGGRGIATIAVGKKGERADRDKNVQNYLELLFGSGLGARRQGGWGSLNFHLQEKRKFGLRKSTLKVNEKVKDEWKGAGEQKNKVSLAGEGRITERKRRNDSEAFKGGEKDEERRTMIFWHRDSPVFNRTHRRETREDKGH